jgi:hypothetical protein
MLIILGVQLLLAAIGLDQEMVPKQPICGGPLSEDSESAALTPVEEYAG